MVSARRGRNGASGWPLGAVGDTLPAPPRTRTLPVVTIDGQNALQLAVGDQVRVKASQNRSSFIRMQERNYFFRSLMDRMEPRFLPRQPHDDERDEA